MSVLNKLASQLGEPGDVPNQALARELADAKDKKGIQEIADNLWNKDRAIQSDCIKVLYEIGYLRPELIAAHVGEFLKLMQSRNNRLVWGSLIALSTVAALRPDDIYSHWPDIQVAMEKGSVITVDAGVKTLAQAAAHSAACRREIWPYLLDHLRTCRPQSVAQHAEAVAVAVDAASRAEFSAVLEKRLDDLSAASAARVKRVLKVAAGG